MNKKTMNFYSYKLLGLLSLTLLSQPASADLFKCNACPAGYKCDGNTQYACPVGTYSHAGASSCTPCPAGQYQDNTAQSSCKSCPAGTYAYAGSSSCSSTCSSYYKSCTCEKTETASTCTFGGYSYCYDNCNKYSGKSTSYCKDYCNEKCKTVTTTYSGRKTITYKPSTDRTGCVKDKESGCQC